MIVVRNCFVAKPGCASKLAAQIKDAATAGKIANSRVLTDVTGEFNRVVLEYDVENLAEFEKRMNEYTSDHVFREKMKGYADLYQTGHRELLHTV
jgi:hypothetical protein